MTLQRLAACDLGGDGTGCGLEGGRHQRSEALAADPSGGGGWVVGELEARDWAEGVGSRQPPAWPLRRDAYILVLF